jgi:hypothetical protein
MGTEVVSGGKVAIPLLPLCLYNMERGNLPFIFLYGVVIIFNTKNFFHIFGV